MLTSPSRGRLTPCGLRLEGIYAHALGGQPEAPQIVTFQQVAAGCRLQGLCWTKPWSLYIVENA
jgi:hypothetical protein